MVGKFSCVIAPPPPHDTGFLHDSVFTKVHILTGRIYTKKHDRPLHEALDCERLLLWTHSGVDWRGQSHKPGRT